MNHHGAVHFVVHKINAKNHPSSIAQILGTMGYKHQQISDIFIEAGKSIGTLQQELIAVNDFLPPLSEDLGKYFREGNLKIFQTTIIEYVIPQNDALSLNSFEIKNFVSPELILSPNNQNLDLSTYPAPLPIDFKKRPRRVTRHSFMFRLFYSVSVAVLGIIIGYIAVKLLDPKHIFTNQLTLNYWQNRIYSPAFIVMALMMSVFALYIFHLFARRLHDAGMNQWLTLLLLTPILAFIVPLADSDKLLLLGLSIIPCGSVFLISALIPSHPYEA